MENNQNAKSPDSQQLEKQRLENMEKWTEEDYNFYTGFLEKIKKSPATKKAEQQEADASYKRFQKKIKNISQNR